VTYDHPEEYAGGIMSVSPEDVVQLPLSIDEITPTWVTNALAVHHPGVEVTSLQVEKVLHGSATKVRLRLEYNEQGRAMELPPTLVLKAGFGTSRRQVAHAYAGEVRFYREIAPEMPVNIPKCYFAGINADTGQSILMLEDLLARKVSFGLATQPLSVETAAKVLELQARYHASYWSNPRLQEDWLTGSLAKDGILLQLLHPNHWAHSMSLPRGAEVPQALRDRERIKEALLSLWEVQKTSPQSLLHGDPHLGNMFFEADGRPGILDWQTTMRGCWAHDFTYFMVGAISIEDRRKHERELLKNYLDVLSAQGAHAPGFEEAWLAYRRHVIHGLMWMACPVQMQPEEVSVANTKRFVSAAEDLDTLAALSDRSGRA
jgi:aminoglycoside/choline kinase family phosphotransferase